MKSFISIVLGLLIVTATGRAAMFTGLGVGGGVMSPDGSTLAGVQNNQMWRWSLSTGMQEFPLSESMASFAISGVSNGGSMIVGFGFDKIGNPYPIAARWSELSGWQPITTSSGEVLGRVMALSADGATYVGSDSKVYRWTESTGAVELAELPPEASPQGMSADGSAVVGFLNTECAGARLEPFRWTASTGIESLGCIPDFQNYGDDISDDGRVIVGQSYRTIAGVTTPGGYYWTEQTGFVYFDSLVSAVSGDGSVIVGENFYWDVAHGARSLREVLEDDFGLQPYLKGWGHLNATDISSDGRVISGTGRNPINGIEEDWVAYLDDTISPNPPLNFAIDVTVVDSVVLSANYELETFAAGGRIYRQADLIRPNLVDFHGQPGQTTFFTVDLPSPGSRAAMLTDSRLDTSVNNPEVNSGAATLTFLTPLVNGPGPDLVLFEAGTDHEPVQLSLDDSVDVKVAFTEAMDLTTVPIRSWTPSGDAPTNFDELEQGSFTSSGILSAGITGIAIDLDQLGVEPFGTISTIHFGSFWPGRRGGIDLALFMGIDSAGRVSNGDFDGSGKLDIADIDLLTAHIVSGTHLAGFDLDGDSLVDDADRRIWVENIKQTYFGDANLDLTVDFADFVSLANHFSEPGGWAQGDFDGSGDVQFPDFVLLADNFGNSADAAASVPEPASGLLLFIGATVLVRQRRTLRV